MIEEPKPGDVVCTRHATHTLYLVEARSVLPHPVSFRKALYGQAWTRVDDAQVPAGSRYREDAIHGLYPYETAQAIAWSFLAFAHAECQLGLAIRLVSVTCKFDYEAHRGDAHAEIEWIPRKKEA